jgi:hypothetical protein
MPKVPSRAPSSALRASVMRASLLACAAAVPLLLSGCEEAKTGPSPAKAAFTPVPTATTAEVSAFLAAGQGGARAKLIYVDRTGASETLCYIDFSEKSAAPAIHVIAAAKQAEVPVISPDGQWAVYASGTGTEAGATAGSNSSVYLVRLAEDAKPILLAADSACEPRFIQNPEGGQTVVYSTHCPDIAWEGHGKTMRVDIDIAGEVATPHEPNVLWPGGGYTGGLSWDERYLCGGGGHVAMLDQQGAKGRPDTLSPNLVQSCNASISSSRVFTNSMMFLTKETSAPGINGGLPWGEWQAILIGDAKHLLKGFMYPKTFAHAVETEVPSLSGMKWHHPEWSNHPYFAVATLNVDRYFKSATGAAYDNTAYQERIYMINLKDSTYLELLRPDAIKGTGKAFDASGLYWPWLWVEVPAGFAETKDWLASKI